MSLIQHTLTRLITPVAQRGNLVAQQSLAIKQLLSLALADISGVIGPVLEISEAYCKAQVEFFNFIMEDEDYPTLPLDLRLALAKLAVLWSQLKSQVGLLTFTQGLPNVTFTGKGIFREAGATSTLESLLSAPTVLGLSIAQFWSMSLPGQGNLGRLSAMDLVLPQPLDFDVFREHASMMKEVVPMVPSVPPLLAVLTQARTPTFTQALVKAGRAVVVEDGATLPQIAQQYMGDADQWRVIASINQLRPPYLSNDPTDQLGEVVGNRVLSVATVIGENTATLTDVSSLYQDQRIRFDFNFTTQMMTVLSVDSVQSEVTFQEEFTFAFSTASVITIYNPSYSVLGRVLKPGDLILIPTSDTSAVFSQKQNPLALAHIYGVDVGVNDQKQLTVTEGDLTLVSGRFNLVQALKHRIETEKGELFFYPQFGCDLQKWIGHKALPFYGFLASIDVRQTVLRDPRIQSILDFNGEIDGDKLLLDMTVLTRNQDQFPMPRFSLDV